MIRLEGKGSGIIIKGEGGGDYTSDESHKAIKALSQKIDPTLAEKCQQMADAAENPRPKRPTVNVISAIDPTLEDGRESFLVEAKTTYSGDHGEEVVLEMCMIQPGQEQCGTSRHQVKIGVDDVTKMRMPLHSGGYLGSNWDLLKPIEFKACFHVKDNTSFFGDCKTYVRRPGDLKMDAFSDD